jgi:hypothetical protein
VAVFAATATLFLAALGFLAFQLADGKDPSLGAAAVTSSKPERPVVVVRRIIKRHVITTVVPSQAPAAVPASSSYSSGYSAPAVSSAPAPAPAPAAPVVTASS